MKKRSIVARGLAFLILAVVGLGDSSAEAARANHNRGIAFSARPRGANLVVIRWNVSRRVRRRATIYDFQYWYDDTWYSFLGTHQPTSGRIPVVARLPSSNARYCLRMIATRGGEDEDGNQEIVGSGSAGNEGPCQ